MNAALVLAQVATTVPAGGSTTTSSPAAGVAVILAIAFVVHVFHKPPVKGAKK